VAKAFGSAVVNTYADGHSYSFYGNTPYTVSTVNECSVNFFKDELLTKDDRLCRLHRQRRQPGAYHKASA
jgi:hypothetical protein